MSYVVIWVEHLRDETPVGAKPVHTIEEGLAVIDKIANDFFGKSCTFQMFELGKEVPLKVEEVEVQRVTESKVKFSVKR